MRIALITSALIASTLLVSRAEAAAPLCSALPDEDAGIPKIYIENGDTQIPLVQKLGRLLIHSSNPIRIIYRSRPTCQIRDSLYASSKMLVVADRPVMYIPKDDATPISECTPPATADGTEKPIELGIGATYLSSCTPQVDPPADYSVREGPTQAYGFITNKNSTQVAITAAEAYLAFGFSEGTGEADPWTDGTLRFMRGPTASTTLTMAAAIGHGMTASLMQAVLPTPKDNSDNLADNVDKLGAVNPEATLGILGAELYDAKYRETVKFLAFKSWGQNYAYYPDKTSDSFDKQNVRDGHYLPWAPTPYIMKMNGADPLYPNAERIYNLVMGLAASDDVDGLLQVAASGLVPKCAMKVKRDFDGSDLSLYQDPEPCGCYFENNVAHHEDHQSACVSCNDDGPCGTGKCRLHYCEAR